MHNLGLFFCSRYISKDLTMKNQNPYNMHYKHRKDTDTVEVYRPQKFNLYFNGAKAARHKDRQIEVTSRYGHKLIIDQWGITHW